MKTALEIELQEKQSELRRARAAREYFAKHQKAARRVRTLERGANNGTFIAPFQYGISTSESNAGYRALVEAFLAKGGDEGFVLDDEQKEKLRIASSKIKELLIRGKNPEEIIKKFREEKKYELINPQTGEKYKSRAFNFFSTNHRMIAEIREYEDGRKTVAWINGGAFAQADPNNRGLVKVLSEREVKDDRDLEDLVSRILLSSLRENREVLRVIDRKECDYKSGLPQTFGNCPTNAIRIMVNYYLNDDEEPWLADSLKKFVENFKSEKLIADLEQKEKELAAEIYDLKVELREEMEDAPKKIEDDGFAAEVAEARRKRDEDAVKNRKPLFGREEKEERFAKAIKYYLSQPTGAPTVPSTKFETAISAHEKKPTPPIYRGCGFRYDLIKDFSSGGVSSLNIAEIFSVGVPRFSMIPDDGRLLDKHDAAKLAGLLITEITTPKGETINIKDLFQPPKTREAGSAKLAEVLHDFGKISFKAVNGRGEEVNFSCDRNRENVFVTRECGDAKVENYFKNKKREGDAQSGVSYDPEVHGAGFSAKTTVVDRSKSEAPSKSPFPKSASSAFPSQGRVR